MNERCSREGQDVAEVLVEPESSSHLTGFRDEKRICHYSAPRLSVYQVVCQDFERIQGRLDFEVEDGCGRTGLVGFGLL